MRRRRGREKGRGSRKSAGKPLVVANGTTGLQLNIDLLFGPYIDLI